MPYFGPAVIGQKAYDEEAEIEKSGSLEFGPAVIGSHPAEPALKRARELADPNVVAEPADEVAFPAPGGEAFSVREVKRILSENDSTAALDRVMLSEFTRPDPRKSALEIMSKAELRRAEPRGEVVEDPWRTRLKM